jgi:hypothetical protein
MDREFVASELVKVARDLTANVKMDRSINPSRFWVVVLPSRTAELADVYFEADLERFGLWARGAGAGFWKGIDSIHGSSREAENRAEELLSWRDSIHGD